MTEYVLGIDGGQTSTKAALVDSSGRVVARVTAGAWDVMANEVGRERCHKALAEVLDTLIPAIPPGCRLVSACFGLTGGQVGAEVIRAWVQERVQPDTVTIVGDTITNLRGADPSGRAGVVVIAGGGSVAWGHDGKGREALAGAHGYLLDDEGSGYELGRQAIIAVLKAHHGRRPPTLLTPLLLDHFGMSDPWELRMAVYTGRVGRPDIAGAVRAIAQAAAQGDSAAQEILRSGGRSLAEMAAAVVRQLGLTEAPVYPTGGVFRVRSLILEPFAETLENLTPGVRIVAPALPPLGGAVIIALEKAGALTDDAVRTVQDSLTDP